MKLVENLNTYIPDLLYPRVTNYLYHFYDDSDDRKAFLTQQTINDWIEYEIKK